MSEANAGAHPVEVTGLHKNFGQVEALKGVDLQIERGSIFGLLGPNGAGKTTLIRQLIGASRPTAGRLSVLGLDPIGDRHALRARIGYMPQEPALYEDLSPRENVRFFGAPGAARGRGQSRLEQRVEEVLDFVGLSSRARDPVHTFSGGMKQRVSLACALVHRPEMIFLDEPTSGIDPQLRAAFWRHFRGLAAEGVTLIISTHQMDEALNCSRLAVLHRGQVLARSAPRDLLRGSGARVRIWRGDTSVEHEASDYASQLPGWLQSYGLSPEVSRIEIEENGLESAVLALIRDLEAREADRDGPR